MHIARRRFLLGRSAVPDVRTPPRSLVAAIGPDCLVHKGIVCHSCGEACEPRAIRFRPARGGVSSPRLDVSACNGCAACVSICPAGAIALAAQAPALVATAGLQ